MRKRLIPAHAGSTRVSSPGYMPGRAHPRSRGVDSGVVAGVVGSSPLTRGRRTQQPDLVVHAGLIPAHAGSTMTWISPARPPRAHPRSRGVDLWADDGGTTRAGSSPLTRGRRAVGLHDGAGPGLIPAHAGSTRLSRPTTCLRTAHPRSRGVDHLSCAQSGGGARLIPAHAGSTSDHRVKGEHFGAHPRSRGVDIKVLSNKSAFEGSSPLTRGRRLLRGRSGQGCGLIPAHAGSTSPLPRGQFFSWAHPRSRGVDWYSVDGLRKARGSSPLTRGRLSTARIMSMVGRLIPAHAGSTCHCLGDGPSSGAHPRSRGVDLAAISQQRKNRGSSPLTRGRPKAGGLDWKSLRLIPAHAGST
ncbi:hypothetical protein HMPREF0058_1573 [Actinomyces urogenitalis DSM 15434]|nr:hypothetical protein HMPREF0058_1573 [Actinomyces urogenitalis DSM 15434]